MDKIIQYSITTVSSILAFSLGGWGLMHTILLVLNFIDYGTGLYAAKYLGVVNSEKGSHGIAKKMMIWVWITISNFIALFVVSYGEKWGIDSKLMEYMQLLPLWVVAAYIFNEVISIGENSVKIGVPMPLPIAKALEVYNQLQNKEGEK